MTDAFEKICVVGLRENERSLWRIAANVLRGLKIRVFDKSGHVPSLIDTGLINSRNFPYNSRIANGGKIMLHVYSLRNSSE